MKLVLSYTAYHTVHFTWPEKQRLRAFTPKAPSFFALFARSIKAPNRKENQKGCAADAFVSFPPSLLEVEPPEWQAAGAGGGVVVLIIIIVVLVIIIIEYDDDDDDDYDDWSRR